MIHQPIDTTRPEPVKLVLERRVKPGSQGDFERWLEELTLTARSSGKLEGSSVLTAGNGEYFLLLRFASQSALDLWQSSEEVRELFQRGEGLASSLDQPVVRSGLETWFILPGHTSPEGLPPKWKMALVTWCALLPQAFVLSFVIPRTLPRLVGTMIGTAIPVMALTWWIMPQLTAWLHPWLFKPASPDAVSHGTLARSVR